MGELEMPPAADKPASDLLRVGRLSYLNALPIYHGIEATDIAFVDGVPTELNRKMARGELDLSLISTAAYLQHQDDYTLLPHLCLWSRGPVRSVILASRRPLEKLGRRRIAFTRDSATSVLMTAFILHAFGVHQYRASSFHPTPGRMPTDADACLLIGDCALRLPADAAPYRYDIAVLWRRLTHTAPVFAVLAARRNLPPSLQPRLHAAAASMRRAIGRNLADPAFPATCRRLFPDLPVDGYLELLRYDFTHATAEGIEALVTATAHMRVARHRRHYRGCSGAPDRRTAGVAAGHRTDRDEQRSNGSTHPQRATSVNAAATAARGRPLWQP